jgi:hypothetical protein
MKRVLLSIAVTLLGLGTLVACPYRVRNVVVKEVVKEVVVTPAVVAVPLVAVTAVVPAYGTAHVPQAAVPQAAVPQAVAPQAAVGGPSPCEKELAIIREELRALRAQVQGGNFRMGRADDDAPRAGASSASGGSGVKSTDALGVFQNKCARCHSGPAAEKELRLVVDGRVGVLSEKQQLAILKRVNRHPEAKGAMPPREYNGKATGIEPLSDQEAAIVADYLDSLVK